MASNSSVGKFICGAALAVFLYYFFWVSVLPFMLIEEDNWIHGLFPPLQYAFAIPAIFGVFFIGGLSVFTLVKIRHYI